MNKLSVCISADSTCDLSPELLQAYGIETLPLYVVMEGKAYKDGVELTPDQLYDKIQATGKIGSTAAINVDDSLTFFTRMKERCDTLIHFTISSEMSSCYQNANIAAQEVGGIYIVDSRSLSTGMALQILRACELANKGMAAEVIVSAVREMTDRVDATFVPESLEYLKLGGRCSSAAALGANLLRIKPCIQVREGVMSVGKKYTGSMENVLVEVRLHALDQHIAGLADAAAQNHHFGVDGGADIGQEQAHVTVNLVQDGQSGFVAGLGGVEDVFAGQILNGSQRAGSLGGG